MTNRANCVARSRMSPRRDRVHADEDIELLLIHRPQPSLAAFASHPEQRSYALGDTASCVRLEEYGDPVSRVEHGLKEEIRRLSVGPAHEIDESGRADPASSLMNAEVSENLSVQTAATASSRVKSTGVK